MSHYKELKKAVTNLDLSKRLKSQDCYQDSLFYWRIYKDKGTILQLCLKQSGGEFISLWGGRLPKKIDNRKLRTYSAYMSGELSELLRTFAHTIVCHPHIKGKRSPYECYILTDGIEDKEYPHVLEETEACAKGLMLQMLTAKKIY